MCGSLIIHQVHYTVYEKLKPVDVLITDNTSGTLYCL